MSSDLVDIFLLSLVAMFNPTLLAAVTIMMLMPNPKRLMAGYLLGAYTTSITCGCVIVFALGGSSSETSTAKHTISPAEDIIVGLLVLSLAWVLRTGRDQPFQERRRAKKEEKLAAKRAAGKPTRLLPRRDGSHPQARRRNRGERAADPLLLPHAADHPRDDCGARFMQFIPIIERVAEATDDGTVPWSDLTSSSRPSASACATASVRELAPSLR